MLCWFLHGSGRRVSREEEHEVVGEAGTAEIGAVWGWTPGSG